ncbi:MAG: CDP-alcohol phosphatidyltransferase family protein [Thermocrinis sp.]|nr:CDP-alcohol phosphatidyltransferase family protein [Thermocrinis sp.]
MNLPNFLSLTRLLLSPLMLFLKFPQAIALFILLAITDALDGFLARRLKQETDLGKVLDPLADKTLLLIALYVLTYRFQMIESTLLFSLLFRDLFILLGGGHIYLTKGFVPKARMLGKITTAYISFAIPFYVLSKLKLFLYPAYVLIFISFLDYLLFYIKTLSKIELASDS